jgi:CRP-like cAMP-binding protein
MYLEVMDVNQIRMIATDRIAHGIIHCSSQLPQVKRMDLLQTHKIPLFSGLTLEQLEPLADGFQSETFKAGAVIFSQGDPADRLYILISGKVAIKFNPPDGEVLTVAEVEQGGVFGWSSTLGRESYTSGACCQEDCETLSLSGQDLRIMCEEHPETGVIILERLAEVIAQRLRNTHTHVVEMLRQGIQLGS